MKKHEKQVYRKYKITEIEVRYLSKPEGTIDMGTKWAIKRDKVVKNVNERGHTICNQIFILHVLPMKILKWF